MIDFHICGILVPFLLFTFFAYLHSPPPPPAELKHAHIKLSIRKSEKKVNPLSIEFGVEKHQDSENKSINIPTALADSSTTDEDDPFMTTSLFLTSHSHTQTQDGTIPIILVVSTRAQLSAT